MNSKRPSTRGVVRRTEGMRLAEFSIIPDYLSRLILKVRAIQAREAPVDGAGSNPTDDNMIDTLQETPGDLSRAEVHEEIEGLDDRQKAELVALLWVGRGDAEPGDWEETVELARERRTGPTSTYLLGQPLVAEHWADGADRIGVDMP